MTAWHLTIRENGQSSSCAADPEKSILEILRDSKIVHIPAVCGGRGVCGKCGIRVLAGELPVTPRDAVFFSAAELAEGCRLACLAHLTGDTEIEIADERDFAILTSYRQQTGFLSPDYRILPLDVTDISRGVDSLADRLDRRLTLPALAKLAGLVNDRGDGLFGQTSVSVLADQDRILDVSSPENAASLRACGAAVDIGTTTIAISLVDLLTGEQIATHSRINRQREFGADVISRIQNAAAGHLSALTASVRQDITGGLAQLCRENGIQNTWLRKAAISGNTTMLQLLLGLPCDSLGRYPFTPVAAGGLDLSFAELFGGDYDAQVMILPGVTAYVGSDITAGILCCEPATGPGQSVAPELDSGSEQTYLLIDLGTNGEMALFSGESVLCTSTAAGPAFEGGNITHGTGSVPGAISKALWREDHFQIETIGNQPPIGICGSGVLDIAAELVRHGLLEDTGLLGEDYFEKGVPIAEGIFFTQKDVRELQLAKSAVRAGIEVLLDQAGLSVANIGAVYLAGGFGVQVNLDNAETIGLFPPGMRQKVMAVGNSSLGGCVQALVSRERAARLTALAKAAREINLSADKRFNDLYMDNMMF